MVAVSRRYDTSPADLWEAMTSADRIPRWFLPITGDLKLGGRYPLQGNAGGQILICEPPRHLKITWEYGGEMSWVEVWIAKDGTGFATVRIDGARRLYTVAAAPMKEVGTWLDQFRRFWERRLDALATEVARGKRKNKVRRVR